MKSRVILLLAALVVTLVVIGEAFAQRNLNVAAAPANEQRVALVIGNGAYKHTAPLVNPPNDARLMAETLASLGFRLVGGRALLNADKPAMEKAIREFGQRLRGGAVGLFYYAGHGVQVRGENYLIPVAANITDESDVKYELVSAGFVLDEMANAGNRLNVVILDACRSNPFGGRGLRSAASGLAQVTVPAGTVISYATQPGNVALDGSAKNSPYTAALAVAMRKPGLGVFETFNEVGLAVKTATGGRQQPWFATSPIEGTFQFVPGAASPPIAIAAPADFAANDRAFWESVKDSKNPDELKAYLDEFPNGRFAGLARARLKSLASAARPPVQVATVAPSTQTTPAPVAALADNLQRLAAGTVFKDCDVCPEMVVIPAGSFTMGSPASEQGRFDFEGPQHPVTISRQFAAGKFEVTRGQFARFVQDAGHSTAGGCFVWTGSQWNHDASKDWRNPGFSQTDNDPVACVNWNDAKTYADWLKRKTGRNYRLLTEAEWEYVARAGTTTAFSWGNSITPQQANYDTKVSYAGSPVAASSRGQTAPVGSYAPNAFGLYDVHGNVWEWTEDCWNGSYSGAPANGSAWTAGDCGRRVLRGGAWDSYPRSLRSANRNLNNASNRIINSGFGFRLAGTD